MKKEASHKSAISPGSDNFKTEAQGRFCHLSPVLGTFLAELKN
jgi:hypothetical protein